MAGVLRDLLAVSRLEAPGSRARRSTSAEVAAEVGDELDALAALRGLVIVRRLTRGSVAGDREALKRALANLLDNAVRLAPGDSRIEIVGSGRTAGSRSPLRTRAPASTPRIRRTCSTASGGATDRAPGAGSGSPSSSRWQSPTVAVRASVRPPAEGRPSEIGLPVAA